MSEAIKKFFDNARQSPYTVHVVWTGILVLIISCTIIIFQNKLQTAGETETRRQQIAGQQSAQYFDDRVQPSKDDSEENTAVADGEAIWQKIAEAEEKEYDAAGLFSGAVYQDTMNNLIWSSRSVKPLSNEFILADGKNITAGEAVQFCKNLNKIKYAGYNQWRLPTQKELMQAYVNGAAKVLANINYVWSGTEFVGDSSRAWMVNMSAGDTASNRKNNNSSIYGICVSQ
jgi:hypothetical protein